MIVVNKFPQKMVNSGYSRDQARRVIVSGLKGYAAARKRAEKSGV